jgi:CDP-diacylglycerol--glycerol-3-phosphate 3-phosphatidyltransferase
VDKVVWQERVRSLLGPVVTLLESLGVTPTQVTLFGLTVHVLSAVIIGAGQPLAGGLVLLLAAACDGLDGQLARRTGRVTRFGAFLDSSVDRIAETVILVGIATYFLVRGGTANSVWAVVVVVALGGSLITSYTRARAEGLGLECKVGAFERPERVLVTVLGLLLGHTALILAVVVLTVLSWYTVYQRVRHVERLVGDEPLHPHAVGPPAPPPPPPLDP